MFPKYTIADFLNFTTPKHPAWHSIHFHINRLEGMQALPAHVITPHKHQFYELFLVREGIAQHKVDYQEYTLSADTFFFISQGQLHFWAKTNRETIKGYRLMFTEDFFHMHQTDNRFLLELIHFDNIYQNPFMPLDAEANALIFTYFDLLFKEYDRSDRSEKALQSLLFLLLSEVQRCGQPQETNKKHVFVFKQFVTCLEQYYAQKWTASDYANALNVSPRHLNRIVQSMTHQSLTEVIQHRIVLEAKRLLTFTNLNVKQISDTLGFEDSAYFARYFRKETGIAPTEFREKSL
ncbi:MAG: helix-turn-helix domain-containing protein [Saprospiraceae bacterium]|nr:helix-turn-helix domain-containing protein [Saprospiraceae bacterium]